MKSKGEFSKELISHLLDGFIVIVRRQTGDRSIFFLKSGGLYIYVKEGSTGPICYKKIFEVTDFFNTFYALYTNEELYLDRIKLDEYRKHVGEQCQTN